MNYWSVVSEQFAKQRGAVWALRVLAVLFLIATYAPVVALDVPFWTDFDGMPWFGALFNPDVFANEVDAFFNLLMVTLPLLVAIRFLAPRARWVLLWAALHVTVFLLLASGREALRAPVPDYVAEVHARGASALFPPIRHHPSGRRSEFSLTPPLERGTLRPGARQPPDATWPYYLLGSDNLGNDVLTRLIYGARISLTIGVLAVSIYVTIGVVLGGLAGYFGGWIDDLLMFLAQVVMTIPALFLILFVLSVVKQPSIYHTMLVIAALNWPTVMRLVRGEFLRQREIDYVAAARAQGVSDMRVIFRHIAPNTMAPVFVSATFGVALAILIESAISFLGLGDQSAPSWGQMLKIGFENSTTGRHLVWAGGMAIFVTVLLLNLLGEGLRDALDPKLRK
ncbi:MAG: ABC transporter permease [Planctomycetota bacterium]|jgi:peptide/nickel transport system permease protein